MNTNTTKKFLLYFTVFLSIAPSLTSGGGVDNQVVSKTDDLTIRLLTPPFFVATKLEAYLGRGGDDPLASHDLEDILNLVDGRETLVSEIKAADEEVRSYIAHQVGALLSLERYQLMPCHLKNSYDWDDNVSRSMA